MRTTFGLEALATGRPRSGAVVSIGVFDGVHLGHRAILAANLERARELGAAPAVVTFRGHPKALLLGRAPSTLTSLDHRLELFAELGMAHAVVLDFDEGLRRRSAEAFVRQDLVETFGARAFVLGFDSKFGRDRAGTPELLRTMGLDVEMVDAVRLGGRAVSSTAIREAVSLGDLESAEHMLGRPVEVRGRIVRGDGRGHGLGFPTANLDLDHELVPPGGVYATRATLPDLDRARRLPSVTNVGRRPTVSAPGVDDEPRVEVHLLDFEGDLYGQRLQLEFAARLRDERRFESLEALREAIAGDAASARQLLGRS